MSLVKKLNLFSLFFCLALSAMAQQKKPVLPDTINVTDPNGKKQGHWIIFGDKKPKSCYKPAQKAEEGRYQDDKKSGVWIEYFCTGKVKSNITYVNGKPEGPATIFNGNGKKAEEGTWKNNRWTGNYKFYNADGTYTEYIWDEQGKKIAVPK